MSRSLPANLETAIGSDVLRPFFAASIALPDEANAWSGIGEITFAGKIFTGVGGLGGISYSGSNANGSAEKIDLTLSGIDPDYSTYLIEQPYRGALVDVYFGVLDEAYQNVSDYKLLSKWRLNSVSISEDETSIGITVSCESAFLDQGRARVKRYTDDEQQRRYPGDKIFEYMPAMQEVRIIWGPEG